jgi:putative sterol carrier protein
MQLKESIGASLAASVAASLRWHEGERLFSPYQSAAREWEAGGKIGPPPFLALLVALTSAAAAMVSDDKFKSHNYYDRLADLFAATGTEAVKLKRDLQDTVVLWQALNDWLDDWEGELGLPTARVHGRLVYVGYPISHCPSEKAPSDLKLLQGVGRGAGSRRGGPWLRPRRGLPRNPWPTFGCGRAKRRSSRPASAWVGRQSRGCPARA